MRALRSFLLVVLLSAIPSAASSAPAGIPDPLTSIVPPVLYVPGGNAVYHVDVRDSNDQPIAGCLVQILASPEVDSLVCWCPGQVHPMIEAVTDALGQATFFIAAGGCIDPGELLDPPGFEVFANGIKIAEVGGVSPDIVDPVGCFPTDSSPGCGDRHPTGCSVSLADGVVFTPACVGGAYDYCFDINGDGRVGMEDVVLLGNPTAVAMYCGSTALPDFPYPQSGVNSEASLALHLSPDPGTCNPVPCVTNGSLVTEGAVGQGYAAYFLACDVGDSLGVRAVEFGLTWAQDGIYLTYPDGCPPSMNTSCLTGLFEPGVGMGFYEYAWAPEPCVSATSDPEDANEITRVLGHMYIYAYDVSRLEIVPHPVTGEARIMACGGAVVSIAPEKLGSVGFGQPGYNPTRTQDDRVVCVNDEVSTLEDLPAVLSPQTNDDHLCPDALYLRSVITAGTFGDVVVAPDGLSLTYTPPPDYHGADVFYYETATAAGAPDTGRVIVAVLPVNDPPVALADSASTGADNPVVIEVLINDFDADGDLLSVAALLTSGCVGTPTVEPGDTSVHYLPNPAYAGWDSFSYVCSDPQGGLDTAAVWVHVSAASVGGDWCDDVESGGWTFGHEHAGTDCTWYAEYSTARPHSPVTSLRTYVGGGGSAGLDFDHVHARRRTGWSRGIAPGALAVWFNLSDLTGGGSGGSLAAYSLVQVSAYDTTGGLLDGQAYCVAVYDDVTDLETRGTWIYQEERPLVFQPGAADYARNPDGSIQPAAGWWYRLIADPAADLAVDWAQVDSIQVEVRSGGGYFLGDAHGMYWDDACLTEFPPPAVSILAPNGGEVFGMGQAVNIEWSAVDSIAVDSVTVEYSLDDGGSWITIASGEPNDGLLVWTVPDTTSDLALVRAIAFNPDLLAGADRSDAVFRIVTSTGVGPAPGIGGRFALAQNRPNPFTGATAIRFEIPEAGEVQVGVYSVSGGLVARVLEAPMSAGVHEISWNGRDDRGRSAPPGIYLFRLEMGNRVVTRKAIRLP